LACVRRHLWACGTALAASLSVLACAGAVGGTAAALTVGGRRSAGARHLHTGNEQSKVSAVSSVTAFAAADQNPLVPKLSASQLAGQRVIYSYAGRTPPASLLSAISKGEAAGVIFYGANISSRKQIAHVISELEKANASSHNPARQYPLLLMVDQEGGKVRRLPGAPKLSEKQIGEIKPLSAAEAATRSAGKYAAANLRSVGMNVNLAPVVDVYRKAGDFDDQFQRSYSKSPAVVSDLGASFITAQQAGKVAATAKHFPGLGAATARQDTDVRPVSITLSASTLRSVDEFPYIAAIRAGVKLVMLSWASYPKLDPSGLPAGLSPKIVQGELRERLGFKGVTITDSIGAGALTHYGSIQHRATLAAAAGMELILSGSGNVAEGASCTAGLQTAYEHDSASAKAAFQAAVTQILALRHSLPK
jgi:beta-N-acetylhexosaminidase